MGCKMQKVNFHKSKLLGKLEDFEAYGTNTITNKFCYDRFTEAKIKNKEAGFTIDICGVCYSEKSLKGYRKATQTALDKNEILAEKLLDENEIKQFLTLKVYERFLHHGDLLTAKCDHEGNIIKKYNDYTMIENFCRIAEYNPHCTFSIWTKQKKIITRFFNDRNKPINLIVIYSNLNVNKPLEKIPHNFDKVFNNVLKMDYVSKQNCSGQKCKDCLRCYKHSDKLEDNLIYEAVK